MNNQDIVTRLSRICPSEVVCAFDRYFRLEGDDLRSIYASATPDKNSVTTLKSKVAEFKKQKSQ